MKKTVIVTACCFAFAVVAVAQQGTAQTPPAGQGQRMGAPFVPPASVAAETNTFYTRIADFISKSAVMVPEDKMKYQPTPDVRSFARLFGHIMDDNNGACWALAGLPQAPARVDTPNSAESGANKLTKAEILKGLEGSVALCQQAFAAVTPANMMLQNGRGSRTNLGTLIYNTAHVNEHYGNLVTYLRLNGMVPPSSGGS
jgi:DinB superfamily